MSAGHFISFKIAFKVPILSCYRPDIGIAGRCPALSPATRPGFM